MNLKPSCIRRFQPAVDQIEELLKNMEKNAEHDAAKSMENTIVKSAAYNTADSVRKAPLLVAIDGRCGGGKTTLGTYLQEKFGGNLFHMDDFYLQTYQRTKERLAEVGGNVDYERFSEEVLKPVQRKETVHYRRFSCKTWEMGEAEEMPYQTLNIIEGSYSLHPYFGEPYDLKIFIDIDPEHQLENIRRRNGEEALENFKKLWIPKEEAYFEKFGVEKGCLAIRWVEIGGEE